MALSWNWNANNMYWLIIGTHFRLCVFVSPTNALVYKVEENYKNGFCNAKCCLVSKKEKEKEKGNVVYPVACIIK